MFVTEGEKIYVECPVFIGSFFAKLKANTGNGARKRDNNLGQAQPEESSLVIPDHFFLRLSILFFIFCFK